MDGEIRDKKAKNYGFARTLVHFRVRRIATVVFLTLLCALFDGIILGGIKLFVDLVMGKTIDVPQWVNIEGNSAVFKWVVVMCLVVAVKLTLSYVKMVKTGGLFVSFEKHYQKKLLLAFPKMGNAFLRREQGAECAFHFNTDFRVLEKGTEAVFLFVHALIQLAIFIPILFFISWKLSLIILFCMIPIIAVAQNRLVRINKPIERLLHFRGVVHTKVSQYLSLITKWTHRSSLREMNSTLHKMVSEMAEKDGYVIQKKAVIFGVSEFIANVGSVFVFALAGYFILTGELAGEDVIIFLACLFLLYKPAKEFSRVLPLYKDAQVAWENISSLLNTVEVNGVIRRHIENTVLIDSITFSYSNNPAVFHSLCMTVSLEKPIIISGSNGIGKSTFLKLIAGLEVPQKGTITLPNGVTNVGYLDQDPQLPFVSLQTLGLYSDCSKKRSLFADLKIDIILEELKDKNISELHELGMELSGGQRQRLALAVMVVSETQLLLLDEPTSYIPAAERLHVLQTVITYCAQHEKSIIIVSHESLTELHGVKRIEWNERSLL